jgi:hypothetical protein
MVMREFRDVGRQELVEEALIMTTRASGNSKLIR